MSRGWINLKIHKIKVLTLSVKNYLFLSLIYLALIGLGFIVTTVMKTEFVLRELIILLTGAFIISIISSIVFFRGLKKEDNKGAMHTLSAVGLKFLLFLALLGIFALIFKELSWHFLVAYFIAYIAFTIYLLVTFVNILKKKHQNTSDEKRN